MLSCLEHCDKVDIVAVDHLIDELDELTDEALVLLEPGCVEVQAQGSAVGVEVPVEVVAEQAAKLFGLQDVGARGDHVTTGQPLVKAGVVSPVQLIDDHLPDGVAPGGAALGVAVALVRHAVVQGVWPDGDTAKRGSDGSVIDEELKLEIFC